MIYKTIESFPNQFQSAFRGQSPSSMDNDHDEEDFKESTYSKGFAGGSRPTKSKSVFDESNEISIAVMGATGSGKSTFINLASGSSLRVGRGLISCTKNVQVAKPFELDGRFVTLMDTPGFDDTTTSDTDILRMIATFLAATYERGKKLSGILYFHRISDFKMGGSSTRNFKLFRDLCGDSTLKNVIIVTNMWGEVSREVGEMREEELVTKDLFFKPVLDKGALLQRHTNTTKSALSIIRNIIDNHPLSLQIQRELVDEQKDILETAAGEQLNKELKEQMRKHRIEMEKLQYEMKEAIRTRDKETKQELEIETRKLQAEINRVQSDAEKLASAYNEEKALMQKKMTEFSEASRQESERANAEYVKQIAFLKEQLVKMENNSREEIVALNHKIQGLQYDHEMRSFGGVFTIVGRVVDMIFHL